MACSRRLHSLALALTLLVPSARGAAARGPFDEHLFSELRWRMIGPFRGGRTKAAAGVRGKPERLLHRRRQRRRVEDHRLRPHVEADLRRPADRLDRRDRGRAVEPRRHLRRQRRGPAAARPLDRRRHLQVDRRRQDLDAPRPARRPADSADRRRPAEPEPALRRGARPPVRAERPSAASSARPTAGRRSRRCSTRTRTPAASTWSSTRPTPTSSTPSLWEARQAPVGERRVPRPGQRPLQVDRRRHDLAAADDRPAHLRRDGLGRIGITVAPSDPRRLFATVEASGQGRPLPLRRCRRDAGRASTRTRAWPRAPTTSPRSRSTRRTPTSSSPRRS